MASTERGEVIRALSADDLPAALRLSASAHWNQSLDDWAAMLRLGYGWGLDDVESAGQPLQLAASIVVLPYGEHFAWVSMVLVLPAFQRRGHAQRLLRHALEHLKAEGRFAVLDATPAGHAVYRQQGFVDTWGFARYRREVPVGDLASPPGLSSRPLHDADWAAIDALDRPAFGASRLALLRSLALRLPDAARVVEQEGQLLGFVLGRPGREAQQIGPLIAADDATAIALLHDALRAMPGPVYVDLVDRRHSLLPWLQQRGFEFQRPFTRMVHGAAAAPGDPTTIVLAAGPELG